MYKTHFLFPEQRWGVFKNDVFIDSFKTLEDAVRFIESQKE